MIWQFIIASILIELTPGPNMGYIAALTLDRGRKNGAMAVLGIALGLAIAAAAAGIGLTALLLAYPLAWEALRWAGVAYMFWIAWDIWKSGDVAEEQVNLAPENDGGRRFFMRGLIANILNPKAYLFYVAVLPRFIPPDAGPAGYWVLAAIYVAVATIIHLGIVILAGSARSFMGHHTQRQTTARILAIAVAAIAVWLAFTTGR